ncbi:MAG: ATP-binding protein [Chloroflexi bacterium]|nr:ATP-binding protein [Chloroflexota bacterium]
MLIEFRLQNYRCFKDEVTLSLLATPDDSLNQNVIETRVPSAPRLLRSAVIYGPNASGKSTLLAALNFMDVFVSLSAARQPDAPIPVYPFALDETSSTSPSNFEVVFIQHNTRYQYGFSVDRKRVHGEWLYFWPKGREALVFHRRWDADKQEEVYDFGNLFKGQKDTIRQSTRFNKLFLSVGATFNNPMLSEVYAWFTPGLQGLPSNDIPLQLVAEILKNEHYKRLVLELMRDADLSIIGYDLIEKKLDAEEVSAKVQQVLHILEGATWREPTDIRVLMQHRTASGTVVEIDLNHESQGTQRLFTLAARILEALEQGGIVYIDELDASLHPFLGKALIQMFHDPRKNDKNVQFIFNTHDTTLLDQEIFRRDQIWFTERQSDGSSALYSLAEFSPRKGERLDKGYLLGRYGAVPIIRELGASYKAGERS